MKGTDGFKDVEKLYWKIKRQHQADVKLRSDAEKTKVRGERIIAQIDADV